MAVIKDSAQFDCRELISKSTDVPVQCQALKIDVGDAEDSSTGRLVAPSRLDSNEPIFDDIDAADTVLPTEGVESKEYIYGVCVLLGVGGNNHTHREPLLELDCKLFRFRRRVFGCGSQFPHVGRGCGIGVLEDSGFIGDVEQVLVRRPRLCDGLANWDILLARIGDKRLAARESIVEF